MDFQVTIRYGRPRPRYHIDRVEAGDLREALQKAAAGIPEEIAADADLAEVRPASEPEARDYLEP